MQSLSINNTGWKNGMFGIYARRSRRGNDITCDIVNEMGRSSTTRLKLSTRIYHSRFISRRSLRCRIGSISDWLRLQKVQKLVTLSLCNRTLRRMKPYHSPLEPEGQWWIIHDNYVFHLTMYPNPWVLNHSRLKTVSLSLSKTLNLHYLTIGVHMEY